MLLKRLIDDLFVIQKKGINKYDNNYELFKSILDKDYNINGIYDDLIAEVMFLDLDVVINKELERIDCKVHVNKVAL